MHQLSKRNNLIVVQPVALAYLSELLIWDLRLCFRPGEDFVAGRDRSKANQLTHLRQLCGLFRDSLEQLANTMSGEVVDLIVTDQQLGKVPFQVRIVQLRATLVTVSGDDQGAGIPANPKAYTAQPPSTSFCSWPSRAFHTTR